MTRHVLPASVLLLVLLPQSTSAQSAASAREQAPASQREGGVPAFAAPAKPAGEVPAPRASAATKPVTGLALLVTGPDTKPIEGAVVIVQPATRIPGPPGASAAALRTAVTDPQGKATLDALPAGPWNVSVRARGLVPRRIVRVARGPLGVRLEKGGVITGVVRDSRRRQPVPNARVAAAEAVPAAARALAELLRNEAVTDAKGRFRLEGIGGARVRVVARAAGFDQAGRDARAGEDVVLVLFPGATLTGSVRDDEGRPVPAAVVTADGDSPGAALPAERTDARGEFAMPGVRPGAYVVVARSPTRALAIATVVVAERSEARVSLVASDGGFATGRIVDEDARPLAGRVRVVFKDGAALPGSASDAMTASAGADGRFALGPLPPGLLGMAVSTPRYGTRNVEASVARRATADLGDVVLEAGLVVAGRVRDEEGAAIGGAAVRARLRGPYERETVECASESDGSFVLPGLRAGTYMLFVSAPGYATARATAPAGGDALDVVLKAAGEIGGQVVDAEGRAAEDATVSAERTDSDDALAADGSEGRSDEGNGSFVLRNLAPGRYAVRAVAGGRGEASLAGVRVAAGRRTELGTLRLGAGRSVRGIVVDGDDRGIPGATVAAERDLTMRTAELVGETDAGGAFAIRGVPPGRFALVATHPAYADGRPVTVEVDAEKDGEPVRLQLLEGARIEGRAHYRDGRPVANGRVSCFSFGSDDAGCQGRVPVAPDGSFAIEHAPPGRSMVALLAPTAAGTLRSLAMREVTLHDGETASVDFSLRDVVVAGAVTRGGQPAPGVHVSVTSREGSAVMGSAGGAVPLLPAAGPPLLSATTREDGRYELIAAAPGRSQVTLESLVGNQRYPRREVDIPDVERFELDLELAETSVSGVVVAKESGDPVADAWVRLQRATARSGAAGEFKVAAEPGERQLEVNAPGRKAATLPLSVPAQGVADVRVELERGSELRGRVLAPSGRPAPGVPLVVVEGGEIANYADSLADGSFRFEGLGTQPVTVVAGGDLQGWAVRGGLRPGGEAVTLVLRPGGRVALRVVGSDGQPLKDVAPWVSAVDGVPFVSPNGWASTDANGFAELAAPAGRVDVEVRTGPATVGRGSVGLQPGERVPLELVVEPASAKTP